MIGECGFRIAEISRIRTPQSALPNPKLYAANFSRHRNFRWRPDDRVRV